MSLFLLVLSNESNFSWFLTLLRMNPERKIPEGEDFLAINLIFLGEITELLNINQTTENP